jgi:hypothetical protein
MLHLSFHCQLMLVTKPNPQVRNLQLCRYNFRYVNTYPYPPEQGMLISAGWFTGKHGGL